MRDALVELINRYATECARDVKIEALTGWKERHELLRYARVELGRLVAIEQIARFMNNNRRNFLTYDPDGLGKAHFDKLARLLEGD